MSNAGRAESLLNQLEIKERLLPPKTSIPQDVPPIDYKEVRSRLEVLRQDSLSFLKSILFFATIWLEEVIEKDSLLL
jgi:hypothetical protein